MSMPEFRLPVDPDKRMIVAAMLTCAVANMDCSKDEATRRVLSLYEEILDSATGPTPIGVWSKLADD